MMWLEGGCYKLGLVNSIPNGVNCALLSINPLLNKSFINFLRCCKFILPIDQVQPCKCKLCNTLSSVFDNSISLYPFPDNFLLFCYTKILILGYYNLISTLNIKTLLPLDSFHSLFNIFDFFCIC